MNTKIDLNAPAFGEGAQKIEETTEETVVEPVVEAKEEVLEPSEEESKVPYSRFKKFHDRAIEAERERDEWRTRAEIKPTIEAQTELPDFWVKNYGSDENSQEAWKNQLRLNEQIKEEAKQEALEAVRNERYQEDQRTEENIETLDNHLELVAGAAGRDLNEKEESAILDIIDDYTPKDDNGNYMGAILSADKAWEIYELKQQATKGARTKTRDSIASLSGTQTRGEPTITDKDASFNPLDWNSYQRRL